LDKGSLNIEYIDREEKRIKRNSIQQTWLALNKQGRLMIVREYISRVVMALILFLISGNWRWQNAWLYFFFALGSIILVHLTVVRENPQLYNERGTRHSDTKSWDNIILPLYALGGYLVLVVAALDERYGWSDLAPAWLALGCVVMLFMEFLVITAMRANPFFSSTVRIQSERGQQVMQRGPYAIIRHPGYAGGILYYLASFGMLDSRWVLLPTLLTVSLIIARTNLEDKTLQKELDGYPAYAQKVRFRLFPGIW
jgi:protein-S-isoprenylcysteine O-methyltransferase Ste14